MSSTKHHQVTLLEKLLDSDEKRRLFEEERLIAVVTEHLTRALIASKLRPSEIAEKLGCSRSHISQTLAGTRNMTLRTAASIAWATEHEVSVAVRPRYKPEEEGSAPTSSCRHVIPLGTHDRRYSLSHVAACNDDLTMLPEALLG